MKSITRGFREALAAAKSIRSLPGSLGTRAADIYAHFWPERFRRSPYSRQELRLRRKQSRGARVKQLQAFRGIRSKREQDRLINDWHHALLENQEKARAAHA